MIRVHLLPPGELHIDDPAEPGNLPPGVPAWLEVEAPTPDDLAILTARLGFHPLAVEDCVHPQRRAKFERYPTHGFLVLQPLNRATPDELLDTVGICVFVRPNLVVSVRQAAVLPTDAVVRHLREWPEHAGAGAERVIHALLDTITDDYTELLWDLEARVDALERRAGSTANGVMDELIHARRDLLTMRRIMLPQREVIRRFVDADAEVSPDARMYFRDVLDHVEFVHDETNLLLDVVNGAMQLQASVIDNRLNAVMKYMAVVSTIMLPMTVISGAYGMNFDVIPWAHAPWGFATAVGMMLSSGAGLLAFFRWKRWF